VRATAAGGSDAGRLDDAVDRRQPEAGAAPVGLGREVRIEHARHRVGVHAGAGVGHRELCVAPRAQRAGGDAQLAGGDDVDREPELATVGHRVARVEDQVHEHLLELAAIALDMGVALDRGDDLDVLAEQRQHRVRQLADELAELNRLARERLTLAEREELAAQRAAALARVADLIEVAPHRIVALHA